MKRLFILWISAVLFVSPVVLGQVPQTISYQGVLKNGDGVIVSDGDYEFTFRIYDVPSGGTALWTEVQTIHVSAGILNAVLGEVAPITLPFDEQYWLGVTIGTGDELAPRTRLTGTPYALNAQAVLGTHNEFPDSGCVGIGTPDPDYPLHIVSPGIRGFKFEGTAVGAWAMINIDAAGSGSYPGIEYLQEGSLKAMTYVDQYSDWKLRLYDTDVLTADRATLGIGIGTADPLEKLDVAGAVRLGNTDSTNAGTIRWTGSDFEGYDGSAWQSFTSGGTGGGLPSGALGQTLRHNGSDWIATSFLYNDGDRIGIGTTIPSAELEIIGDNMTNHFKLTATTGAGPSLYLNAVNKDWTIYGSNPGSSAGDRKLVFRDFSAATDRVVIDENGFVGIGETNPDATLHVAGGRYDLDTTEGDFKIGDDDYRLKCGIMTTTAWAGTAEIRVAGGEETLKLCAGPEETVTLRPEGDVDIGTSDLDATFSVYRHGFWARSDSSGGVFGSIEPGSGYAPAYISTHDVGFGAALRIARGDDELGYPEWGFTVEGNYFSSEEPRVSITGSSRAAVFNMSNTDDDSVELPQSAVASHEILDEPGAASMTEGTSLVVLDGTVQTLLQQSITVPATGYVQVIATGQPLVLHTKGTQSAANFGVSDTLGVLPDNQDVGLTLPDSLTTGDYKFPVTVHGLFEVPSSGTYTFYFLADQIEGVFWLYDMQLTLTYIPTAYGTVVSTLLTDANIPDEEAYERPPVTRSDIEEGRLRSRAVNRERIERELERITRELEALKREMAATEPVRVRDE